jgi:RimJ/RimL family protein N-acetyltransferase
MSQILETERLILREFTTTDSAFIIALVNSPGWLQYIGDRNIKTEEAANNYLLNGPIKSYKENGFGLGMVELKEKNTPVGMCGILKRDTLPNPDIGFAFLPGYNGMGYAFEIAKATIDHATSQLKIPLISAITVVSNTRSIRLLEKIGLSFNKVIIFPGSEEELLLFDNDKNRTTVTKEPNDVLVNPTP